MFVNLISPLYISQKMEKKFPHVSKMCNEVYRFWEKYEKMEFFHVGRNNPYAQKCDILYI